MPKLSAVLVLIHRGWLCGVVNTFASSGEREDLDETHISTKQPQTKKNTRLLGANEHPGRSECVEAEEGEGKKEVNRLRQVPRWALCEGAAPALYGMAMQQEVASAVALCSLSPIPHA